MGAVSVVRPRPRSVEFLTWTNELPPGVLSSVVPQRQHDFPNPQGKLKPPSLDLRTWVNTLPPGIISKTLPQRQTNWPNPLPKNPNLELRAWFNDLPPGILAKTLPKAQWDWPNPLVPLTKLQSVELKTWINRLPPGSIGDTIPKAQWDWPNPTPAKPRSLDLRFWSQPLPSGEISVLTGQGAITSTAEVLGVSGTVVVTVPTQDQPSGGFGYGYDRELRRRSAIRAKQRKLDEETAALSQPIDREIGLLLREQEAKDQKRQELERLRALANDLSAEQARRDYGERVAKALDRAVQQANYSALAALDREIQRAQEEEEHAILAVTLLIHESD